MIIKYHKKNNKSLILFNLFNNENSYYNHNIFDLTLITVIIINIFMKNIYSIIKSNKISVPNLNDPEKILLWAIREWVINIKIAKDPRPKLIEGFSKVLIQESVMTLDKTMRLVSYHFISPIDIRCHCSNLIGKTEIEILSLISILQNNSSYDIEPITQKINKVYLNKFLSLSTNLALSFQRANLLFPLRDTFIKNFTKRIKSENQVIYFDFKRKLYK